MPASHSPHGRRPERPATSRNGSTVRLPGSAVQRGRAHRQGAVLRRPARHPGRGRLLATIANGSGPVVGRGRPAGRRRPSRRAAAPRRSGCWAPRSWWTWWRPALGWSQLDPVALRPLQVRSRRTYPARRVERRGRHPCRSMPSAHPPDRSTRRRVARRRWAPARRHADGALRDRCGHCHQRAARRRPCRLELTCPRPCSCRSRCRSRSQCSCRRNQRWSAGPKAPSPAPRCAGQRERRRVAWSPNGAAPPWLGEVAPSSTPGSVENTRRRFGSLGVAGLLRAHRSLALEPARHPPRPPRPPRRRPRGS